MSEFKLGDLVWARMKGFPPWPGKISLPPDHLKNKKPKGGKQVQCIFFFGSNNYGWIEDVNCKLYDENRTVCEKAAKTVAFKEACAAIQDYQAKLLTGEINAEDFPFVAQVNTAEPKSDGVALEVVENDVETKRRGRKPSKKLSIEENGDPLKEAKKEEGSVVRKRKHNGAKVSSEVKPPANSPAAGSSGSAVNHVQRKSAVANILDRPITVNKTADTPLNISHVSQTLKDKKITPSTLRFGFLGLGNMGSGIVKNLLNSGHKVSVWNRTTDKCNKFVIAGAEQGITPGDVIQTSDITFSCVSDPIAAKEMVFGNCGVLQEITASKGYVEMTGMDSETSMDIAEAIGGKGGRYLEAQIQGSKPEAEDGKLVILAAGDRDLYEDCQSAFQAMGKHSFYLGDVGNASKMNIVMQLLQGVGMAALAEGMALADRAGLQQRDVMEILALTSLNCPLFVEKGNGIIEGTFPTHQPLQHMQKDLNLALGMGHSLEQPLPLAASANEIFKHAKRLGYGEHDMAAVYIRARF